MTSVPQAIEPKVAARFHSKVVKAPGDECWLWQGYRSRGYGTIAIDGKTRRATHVSVAIATGQWPEPGLVVCHRCDNPSCVRPDHLFVGTHQDNVRDRVAKGRSRRGYNGLAKLNAEAVREIRSSTAGRLELADRYGIHPTTIDKVRRGAAWGYVK